MKILSDETQFQAHVYYIYSKAKAYQQKETLLYFLKKSGVVWDDESIQNELLAVLKHANKFVRDKSMEEEDDEQWGTTQKAIIGLLPNHKQEKYYQKQNTLYFKEYEKDRAHAQAEDWLETAAEEMKDLGVTLLDAVEPSNSPGQALVRYVQKGQQESIFKSTITCLNYVQ